MKKILLFRLATLAFFADLKGQSLPVLIPYFDGNKWGYVDSNGHVMIKPQWRSVDFFDNGKADVYTTYSHCIIDKR